MAIIRCMLLGIVGMLAATLVPAAADDAAQRAVNNPADSVGIWGTAKLEPFTDPSVPGGAFRRITIIHQPIQPWDVGAYVMVTKPVKKGDVLLLAIWARAAQPPAQSDFIASHGSFTETAPPNRVVTEDTSLLIGKNWKLYYLSGTADRDFAPGSLSAGMLLGTGEQAIDFASPSILDYGAGYSIDKLPHN